MYDNVYLRELERIVVPVKKSQTEPKSAKPAEFKVCSRDFPYVGSILEQISLNIVFY